MGLYLSPWDRNEPLVRRLAALQRSLLRPAHRAADAVRRDAEVWFDGANGEGPNGKKQEYDWPRVWALGAATSAGRSDLLRRGTGRALGAATSAASPARPTGPPSIPPWCRIPGAEGAAVMGRCSSTAIPGTVWRPGETDVSIRPGWFYREECTRQAVGALRSHRRRRQRWRWASTWSDQAGERRDLDPGDQRPGVGAADRRPRRLLAEPRAFTATPIAINVKVKDTRGYDVRDVLVFLRSTPLVTSTPNERRTADGRDGHLHRAARSQFPDPERLQRAVLREGPPPGRQPARRHRRLPAGAGSDGPLTAGPGGRPGAGSHAPAPRVVRPGGEGFPGRTDSTEGASDETPPFERLGEPRAGSSPYLPARS